MFYDLFKSLCDAKGVYVSKACIEMGLSRSIAAKWKNTKTNPSAEVLPKIAKYFGVTTDYLLTGEQKEKPAAESSELDKQLEGVEFALWGEVKELTDAQKRDVLKFARFLKEQAKEK